MTEIAKKKKNLQKHIEKLFEKKQQGFDVKTDLNKAYDELTRLECMEAMGIQREEDVPITEDEAEKAGMSDIDIALGFLDGSVIPTKEHKTPMEKEHGKIAGYRMDPYHDVAIYEDGYEDRFYIGEYGGNYGISQKNQRQMGYYDRLGLWLGMRKQRVHQKRCEEKPA